MEFKTAFNRRQVAAYAGLAPTPCQSGSIDREQGVSKAGQSKIANNADPTGLAMVAAPTGFDIGKMVQGTR